MPLKRRWTIGWYSAKSMAKRIKYSIESAEERTSREMGTVGDVVPYLTRKAKFFGNEGRKFYNNFCTYS